jgi:hypothetical protein
MSLTMNEALPSHTPFHKGYADRIGVWPNEKFVQQAAAQLLWGQNQALPTRLKDKPICARGACTLKTQFHQVKML